MVRRVGEDEEGGEASHSIVTPEHLHSCTLTLVVHRCGCCNNTVPCIAEAASFFDMHTVPRFMQCEPNIRFKLRKLGDFVHMSTLSEVDKKQYPHEYTNVDRELDIDKKIEIERNLVQHKVK